MSKVSGVFAHRDHAVRSLVRARRNPVRPCHRLRW